MDSVTAREPQRLLEAPDLAGRVLRHALARQEDPGREVLAWNRLERRLPATSPGWGRLAARLVLAVLLAGLAALMAVPLGARLFPQRPAAGMARHLTLPAPSALVSRPVPPGRSALADGSRVELSPGGRAAVEAPSPGQMRVRLEAGQVALAVTPKRGAERLEVMAGGFVFRVVGTEFTVSLAANGPRLDVREGTVAVLEGERQVALIGAGESWQRPPEPAPEASAAAAPSDTAAVGADTDCLAAARRGAHQAALTCFEAQARGSGLPAEIAEIEGARLRRDVLGAPRGALAALQGYRRRHPGGAFAPEAAVPIVEILAELGDTPAALAESEALLASSAARERAPELRLLRGRLLRQAGDLERAAEELAMVAAGGGPLAAPANLARGACLEDAGRVEEARALYRELAASSEGAAARSAAERLRALEGTSQGDEERTVSDER